MHFSIPDSVEIRGVDCNYLMYNVYINGNFHCSLRYRQFLGLHEQLKREFGVGTLLPFPPKKFLSLTANQLEERRSGLEKYIQHASQNNDISSSELFTGFLRLGQHETSDEPVAKRSVDVFLPNGHKLNVDVWNNSPSSVLLGLVTEEMKLSDKFIEHFGLYIYRKEPDGTWIVVRKLEEYESPCISIKWLSEDYRIVMRKCSWDLSKDNSLIDDDVGLFLVYVQTVADIENGWIPVPREVLKQLTTFQSKGNKREYVMTARKLKYYGYMKFPYCLSENIQPMTELTIYIGNKELIIVTPRREEIVYKVTRMKCWRITLHHEMGGGIKSEMSFEYLRGKDNLEWITITSEQAVIMALCLKEIVNDMVSRQHPQLLPCRRGRMVKQMLYYIRRDGNHVALNEDLISNKAVSSFGNGSRSVCNGSSGNSSPTMSNGYNSNSDTPSSSLNGSTEIPLASSCSSSHRRPSTNALRRHNLGFNSSDNLFLENSAFAGIGDDDL